MARHARIIGSATDHWGDRWDVRERRPTRHGFFVQLGWPSGEPRGRGGSGGPRIIVTGDLAGHFETHRRSPAEMAIPIGSTAIKRVRRLLGHHRQIDAAAWWDARIDDLSDLTVEAFAARYSVSTGATATARIAHLGRTMRPAGWWRQPEVAAILTSTRPRADIADQLNLAVGSVSRLRCLLKEHERAKKR